MWAWRLVLAWVLAGACAWTAWRYPAWLSVPGGDGLAAVAGPAGFPAPPGERPRRTLVVLVDGLGEEAASPLRTVELLRQHGTCWPSHAELPSVSRPNYTVLSTGVPPAQSGVRHNAGPHPVAAESVWALARRAGLRVQLVSEEDWWTALFPAGFDRFHQLEEARTVQHVLTDADVTLWHILNTDDAGHQHGATSLEYAGAVALADRLMVETLQAMDLSRDLVMVTADHGHVGRGGHGGAQPDAVNTLTCAAGPGVPHGVAVPRVSATVHALLLAHWLRLSPPRHAMVTPASATVAEALGLRGPAQRAWLSQAEERWSHVPTEAGPTAPFWGAVLLCACGVLAAARKQRARVMAVAAWMVLLTWWGWGMWAGTWDTSAVNTRPAFVSLVVACGALASVLPLAWAWRTRTDLQPAFLGLAAWGALVLAAHAWAVGWPPPAPLPAPWLFFAPIPWAIMTAHWALLSVVAAGTARVHARQEPGRSSTAPA